MAEELWEPNFERMMTVLERRGEPDRVPFFELFHDPEIIQTVMGEPIPGDPDRWRQYRIDFMTRLGYDYVVGYHTYRFSGYVQLAAQDTAIHSRGHRTWQDEHRGPIQTWRDFEEYPWPNIDEASFEDLEKLEPMLPDGMKVTTLLPGGMLENLCSLMGYERLCYALADEPELVQAVADRIGECLLAMYETVGDMEHIGALWLNDDLGFKTQTMISPDDLRRYVLPWHKRLVDCAHEHGKLVMLHSCGNLAEVMDDLIDWVGIDAKHSFEDVIQPVWEFKAQYGDRVAALGGIDMDILTRGTEEQVRAYTRKVIERCAPGGGWALGSGNSVANYVPVANFLAMLDEGRKAGVYAA